MKPIYTGPIGRGIRLVYPFYSKQNSFQLLPYSIIISQTFTMSNNSSFHSHEHPSLDQHSGSGSSQAAGSLSQGYTFAPGSVDPLPLFDMKKDLLLQHKHPVDQELTGTPEDKWALLGQRLTSQPFARIPGTTPLVNPQSFEQGSAPTTIEPPAVDQRPGELILGYPANSSMQTGWSFNMSYLPFLADLLPLFVRRGRGIDGHGTRPGFDRDVR